MILLTVAACCLMLWCFRLMGLPWLLLVWYLCFDLLLIFEFGMIVTLTDIVGLLRWFAGFVVVSDFSCLHFCFGNLLVIVVCLILLIII